MKEGQLYCENCGEEIKVVPEFEPELDASYRKVMKNMTDMLQSSVADAMEGEESKAQGGKAKGPQGAGKKPAAGKPARRKPLISVTGNLKQKFPSPVIWIVAALLLLLLLVAGGLVYLKYLNLEDTRLSKGEKAVASGDYIAGITAYKDLLKSDPQDAVVLEKLAEAYMLSGNSIMAESTLWDLLASPECTEDQALTAYDQLVSIYTELGDYISIADFLEKSGYEELKTKYAEYLSPMVSFSPAQGYYNETQLLKLEGREGDKIYFTTDGSDPVQNGTLYEYPILLTEGDTEVKVYAKSSQGIQGPVLSAVYHITEAAGSVAEVPILSDLSGAYDHAVMLSFPDLPEGLRIYYTLNGESPDLSSELFPDVLPLPEGHSILQYFVMDDRGMQTEVFTEEYDVSVESNLSMEVARACIFLLTGASRDNCDYRYEVPVSIGGSDYYLYREYHLQGNDTWIPTEAFYGVNCLTGETGPLYYSEEEHGYYLGETIMALD
ncbi:MAG: chitobiase/beta-hexosaminidase C-terminal domain-containing protein [Lachnospiraceae bacterium]|nr:chitobiase/beta-hexosaminidase C-terminal domain-containing protein [Lachnospiraceae bacterium]